MASWAAGKLFPQPDRRGRAFVYAARLSSGVVRVVVDVTRKPLDVAPWMPPIAAEIIAKTNAINSQ